MSGLGVEFRSESPIGKPVVPQWQLACFKTTGKGLLVNIPTTAAKHAYLQEDNAISKIIISGHADLNLSK